jgi:hypothetical protein
MSLLTFSTRCDGTLGAIRCAVAALTNQINVGGKGFTETGLLALKMHSKRPIKHSI